MPTTLQSNMKRNILFIIILLALLGCPDTFAEPVVTSVQVQDSPVCDPKCGCDGYYIYDDVKDECVLNLRKLMKRVLKRYDNQNDDDILAEEGMAKSIYIEGQKLFRGIMISVILFMTCATLCVLSACIYCCRINYTDRKLKNEVKAIEKKRNKGYDSTKPPLKRKVIEPKSESCNVIVEQAGVFVV